MKEAPLNPDQVTRVKLISRIALAQNEANSAKKAAKLAKLEFRQAKKKLKEAKRAAKLLRKAVKALKHDLAAAVVKKPRPQTAKRKVSPRRKVAAAGVLAPAPADVTLAPSDPSSAQPMT